jgi:hypothetical protein
MNLKARLMPWRKRKTQPPQYKIRLPEPEHRDQADLLPAE